MSKSEIPNTEIWLNSLSGEHWNRTTIADGKWLNKNTIQPLFENDCILASAIHDTSAALIATSAYFEDRVDGIQGEIDVINAGSDVIDVLGAHSALNTYSGWTTYNDVIKILNDETHSGEQTYYRYTAGDPESGTIHPDPSGWGFVGELAPYYSKTESNAMSAYLYNYTTTASGDLYDKILTSATNLQNDIDYVSGQADYSAAYLYHVIESTSGKMEVVGGRYVEVLNETHPDGMVTYSADLYADKIIDLEVDGHLDISTQGNTSTITCDASKIIFGSGSAPEDIKLTTITDVGTQTSGSSNVILGVIPKEPGGTYSQKAFVTNKVNGTQSYGWQELSGFVRADIDQTALLSSTEQAQARANLGILDGDKLWAHWECENLWQVVSTSLTLPNSAYSLSQGELATTQWPHLTKGLYRYTAEIALVNDPQQYPTIDKFDIKVKYGSVSLRAQSFIFDRSLPYLAPMGGAIAQTVWFGGVFRMPSEGDVSIYVENKSSLNQPAKMKCSHFFVNKLGD